MNVTLSPKPQRIHLHWGCPRSQQVLLPCEPRLPLLPVSSGPPLSSQLRTHRIKTPAAGCPGAWMWHPLTGSKPPPLFSSSGLNLPLGASRKQR